VTTLTLCSAQEATHFLSNGATLFSRFKQCSHMAREGVIEDLAYHHVEIIPRQFSEVGISDDLEALG
jgi:hypothetical protein